MAFNGPSRLLPPVGEEEPSFPTLKKSLSANPSRKGRSRSPRHAHGISTEPVKETDSGGGPTDTTKSSKKDPSLLLDTPTIPRAAEAALMALKYLPTPLLVLSSQKTVLLANEAMGRLLGLDSMDEDGNDSDSEDSERPQSLDLLRGQTLSQIGIDIFEDGQAIRVSWEVRRVNPKHSNDRKFTHMLYRNSLISLRMNMILAVMLLANMTRKCLL